tara:strand:+ start:46 stop:342 length:297 start_codon:yes stop_codon:yes gene_type:complete
MRNINLKPDMSVKQRRKAYGGGPAHSRVRILSGGQEIEIDHTHSGKGGGNLRVRWKGHSFYIEPTNSAGQAIELFSVVDEATGMISHSTRHETYPANS